MEKYTLDGKTNEKILRRIIQKNKWGTVSKGELLMIKHDDPVSDTLARHLEKIRREFARGAIGILAVIARLSGPCDLMYDEDSVILYDNNRGIEIKIRKDDGLGLRMLTLEQVESLKKEIKNNG